MYITRFRTIVPAASLAAALAIVSGCEPKDEPTTAPDANVASVEVPVADTVLKGAAIATMNEEHPSAEALAIKDGVLIAVGSNAQIDTHIGQHTKVHNLEGMFVTPGFIEGHGHYMSLGRSLSELELRNTKNWGEILTVVEEAVKTAKPGEWIVGRGWHQDKWDKKAKVTVEGVPVHKELSALSPNNPVMLVHTSGHAVFANAMAMDQAGINKKTSNPPGGEIVRGKRKQPTGMLREAAQDAVRKALADHLAKRSPADIEAWQRDHAIKAAEESLANGITSFQDMGVSFQELDLLKQMADEGKLPVRLYMAIEEDSSVMEKKLADYRMVDYGDGYLTVRAIGEKVLDGALGTHGGWLLEPYTDMPRSSGLNVVPVDEIVKSASLAIEHDYQMAIQGIGDRAVRELFNIYDKEFKENPDKKDLRWRIEHAQVVHPGDLPRFVDMGVIPSIQGIFACSDGIWAEDRLGPERTVERGYIWGTMFNAGAIVTNGTDPPVEDIDPIASFHCSVTRKLADGTVFLENEKMTRQQALRSYTSNNAYAAFEEDHKGSLEVGKWADITVFSQNLLTVADEEIMNTKVMYTIVDGEIRYRDPSIAATKAE